MGRLLLKLTIRTALFATALLAATSAEAANAIVTANLNVRAGPGTNYPVLGTIPNGAPIDVIQCASNYNWCDIAWAGRRAWASSNYIAFKQGYGSRGGNFSDSAAAIGIPLLAGALIGAAVSNYDYHSDWGRRPPRRPPPPPPGPHGGFRPVPPPGGGFGPGPRPPAFGGNAPRPGGQPFMPRRP